MNRVAQLCLAVVSLLALSASSGASAQDVVRRDVDVRFVGGVARVSATAAPLIDSEIRRRLQSGLPQTLLTRVYAYRGASGTPIAIGIRSCRITWDLWDLEFRVQRESATGEANLRARSIQEVLRECVDLRALPVGGAAEWREQAGRQVWFAALIELNPISRETVRRVRRWLARPGGVGPSDGAFFGSFVSLFVNRRISQAERTIRFRSTNEIRCP